MAGRFWKCTADTKGTGWFTVGKVYAERVDGSVIDDQGFNWSNGIKHHVRYNGYKFEEVFENMAGNTFCKSMLRSGDVVETKQGRHYVVMLNSIDGEDIVVQLSDGLGWNKLSYYNDNLTCSYEEQNYFDIVKVYRPSHKTKQFGRKFSPEKFSLIYERKEKKKMTVAEISQILGYDIEVVKG